jgi:hypothetical protein
MRFRLSLAFLLAAFGMLVDEYMILALGLFLGLRRLPWL